MTATGSSRPSVISTSIDVAPEVDAGEPDVGAQLDQGRPPPAARRRRTGLADQTGRHETVEFGHNPGPRKLQHVAKFGPREGSLVPEEAQDAVLRVHAPTSVPVRLLVTRD